MKKKRNPGISRSPSINERFLRVLEGFADDPNFIELFEIKWIDPDYATRSGLDYIKKKREKLNFIKAMEQEFNFKYGKNKNPGERWHKQMESQYAELYEEASRKGMRHHKDYFEGKADAHRDSAIVSRRMGMNPKRMSLITIKEQLYADTLSFKNGVYTARWGFFYTHGRTSEKYAAKVKAIFPEAIILDFGKHWAPFRGGASIGRSSHFWVKFKLEESLVNPLHIPERVLAWREKLRAGTIMKPKTFRRIKGRAAHAGYIEPMAVGGKAYWITLLRKYLDTHPSDSAVQRILNQLVRRRWAGAKNPFDIGTAGAIATGIVAGEVGKCVLEKSRVLGNPGTKDDKALRRIALRILERSSTQLSRSEFERLDRIQSESGVPVTKSDRDFVVFIFNRFTRERIKNPKSSFKYYIGIKNKSPRIGYLEGMVKGTKPTKSMFPMYDKMVGAFDSLAGLGRYAEANRIAVKVSNPKKIESIRGRSRRTRTMVSFFNRENLIKKLMEKGYKRKDLDIVSIHKLRAMFKRQNPNPRRSSTGKILKQKARPGFLELKHFMCHNCLHKFSKEVPRHQIQIMCPICKDYYASIRKKSKNPSTKGAVKIYDNILAIEAQKGKDSHFPNEEFRHDFSKSKGKASIFGMPDGSLVIKGNKKLWRKFDYD